MAEMLVSAIKERGTTLLPPEGPSALAAQGGAVNEPQAAAGSGETGREARGGAQVGRFHSLVQRFLNQLMFFFLKKLILEVFCLIWFLLECLWKRLFARK
jgi:hypothetical protein